MTRNKILEKYEYNYCLINYDKICENETYFHFQVRGSFSPIPRFDRCQCLLKSHLDFGSRDTNNATIILCRFAGLLIHNYCIIYKEVVLTT